VALKMQPYSSRVDDEDTPSDLDALFVDSTFFLHGKSFTDDQISALELYLSTLLSRVKHGGTQ